MFYEGFLDQSKDKNDRAYTIWGFGGPGPTSFYCLQVQKDIEMTLKGTNMGDDTKVWVKKKVSNFK